MTTGETNIPEPQIQSRAALSAEGGRSKTGTLALLGTSLTLALTATGIYGCNEILHGGDAGKAAESKKIGKLLKKVSTVNKTIHVEGEGQATMELVRHNAHINKAPLENVPGVSIISKGVKAGWNNTGGNLADQTVEPVREGNFYVGTDRNARKPFPLKINGKPGIGVNINTSGIFWLKDMKNLRDKKTGKIQGDARNDFGVDIFEAFGGDSGLDDLNSSVTEHLDQDFLYSCGKMTVAKLTDGIKESVAADIKSSSALAPNDKEYLLGIAKPQNIRVFYRQPTTNDRGGVTGYKMVSPDAVKPVKPSNLALGQSIEVKKDNLSGLSESPCTATAAVISELEPKYPQKSEMVKDL